MIRLTRLGLTLSLAMGIAGLVFPALGQEAAAPVAPPPTNPGTGAGTPTPTPGRPTNPGRTTPEPTNNPNNPFPEMQQQPIFLSGRVMLDAGMAPPDPVVIERVCNGNPRAEAYTDSKGHFSFQLGQNNGMLQDASIGSSSDGFGGSGGFGSAGGRNTMGGARGVSERDLMGCEVRAVLAGYRSDMINLSGRRALDNPDLGTIVLHRLSNVEGVTISAISLRAPKDAKKAYDKGRDLLRKKKVAEGQKELEKAVQIYPQYATAWFDLGRAKEIQNDTAGAHKAYAEALAADPKYLYPYRQLMGLHIKEQKWEDAAEVSGKLIRLDPIDFPDAYFYNSVANYYMKNYEVAEKSIREAQKLDTRNRMPKSSQLLGAILIEKQDYTGATEQYKKYLGFLPAGQEADSVKKQLTELERFVGVNRPTPEQ